MKIIILGSSGMLGSYLQNSEIFNEDDVVGISRSNFPDFNFLEPEKTIKLIQSLTPDVIINCVAITSIAACEEDKNLADQINTVVPALISEYCYKKNIFFVHISTDHFYSRGGNIAHKETEPVHLLNHYAVSKFEAENRISISNPDALIIRTSIIGRTPEGRTFLDWVIRSIEGNNKLNLFSNAYVSFIHCNQLSSIIKNLINQNVMGLYNVSCTEVFSKAEFILSLADAIGARLNYQLADVAELNPPRPNSCGLSPLRLMQKTGINTPSMKNVIDCVTTEYKSY
mgnify:CR=1 FL=1